MEVPLKGETLSKVVRTARHDMVENYEAEGNMQTPRSLLKTVVARPDAGYALSRRRKGSDRGNED